MPRRPTTKDERVSPKENGAAAPQSTPSEATVPTRVESLVALLDHCTQAKEAADEIGEKFLSYLLAMAIQESRSAMRQSNTLK